MKEKEIIKGKVNLLSLRIIILVVVFIFALLGMIFDPMEKEEIIIIIIALIFGSLFYVFLLPKLIFGNCEVIVTNKRVYGRATFGKKVDLPFDKYQQLLLLNC